jgi:phospholipid/cholesterol/gamma-HCH transport system substrate-binding protein
MKKLSNEVKVGVTALITILAFIWLYNFLKGKDLLRRTTSYYSVYEKIGGLQESSPVEINGYKVGVVQSIKLADERSGRLLVSFSVKKNFKLPRNTVAEIVPISLLGGMKVQFVYGKGLGIYANGDTIPGRLAESLTEKFDNEIMPLKDKISNLVSVLDSVITSVNEVMNSKFRDDLRGSVANLNRTTSDISNILSEKEKELKATIGNINRFTGMLSDNSGSMSHAFKNLEAITDSLAASGLQTSFRNLKADLEKTSILLDNLNSGTGTAGKLMKNDSLYTNLSSSLESLNLLLQDVKRNPKRYVHFSLFGKKGSPDR